MSSTDGRVRAHLDEARQDARDLAQRSGRVAYVRLRVAGYYASLDPGPNPILWLDPARLPALPVCPLAGTGWRVPPTTARRIVCPGCGRRIGMRGDGTCRPHEPLRRKPA